MDGEQVDSGFWANSQLSDIWLGVCSEFLKANGAAFDMSWSGKLSHIRTKFTSASGAALATFSVYGKVASSVLLLSGQSPEADRTVAEMFVDALRRTVWTQTAASTPHAFSRVTSIKERPLMVVIAWPESTIAEQDHDLVRELGVHLAAAFFSAGITSL
jgi:hypothetical protein